MSYRTLLSSEAIPAPPKRRGRPSRDQSLLRRRAVISAARSEFIEKGYRAATMDAIAARADVAKRSLYLWHADKAALFRACVIDGVHHLDLPSLVTETDLERGLLQFSRALLSALSADYAYGMGALLMHEGRDFPELAHAVAQSHIVILEPLIAFFQRHGVSAADGPRLANLFEAMLLSDLQQRMVLDLPAREPAALGRRAEDTVRLFLHGIGGWTQAG